MGEVHYMISEASKRVGVESHVLRHWEEELELPIERTEMGHRYYTEENLKFFQCIKKLKEEGVLLKEIKDHMPEIQLARTKKVVEAKKNQEHEVKLDQMRELVGQVLKEVVVSNNEVLKKEIGFLLDAKDQLEEERYRRLDAHLRQQQISRKEAAKGTVKKIKELFAT